MIQLDVILLIQDMNKIPLKETPDFRVTKDLIIYSFKSCKNSTYICENNLNKSGVVKIKTQNYCNKAKQISSYMKMAKVV